MKWGNITVQLVFYYKRGDFYWFGESEDKNEKTKWFGDTPRAMNA